MLLDFFSPQMKMLEKDVHLILLEYLFSCGFECPTSYFFPKFFKILNLNHKVGTAIMTCPTSYFSLNF